MTTAPDNCTGRSVTEPVVIGNATLYCGDCLEILPTLSKVDAVVTDPPYGIEYAEWDGEIPDLQPVIAMADCCAVHCGQGELWKYPEPDWVMAWAVPGSVRRTKGGKFKHWEPVLVYGKERAATDFKCFPPVSGGEDRHPCAKQVAVGEWLVNGLSEVGNIILDPFMGSGTTGVACMNLERKFIGIEIEKKYFDIACERIDNAQRQGRLAL